MDNEHIEELRQSYRRCVMNQDFANNFYESFLASSQDIAKRFENTVMIKQKAMLVEALAHLINLVEHGKPSERLMHAAKKHDRRHLNIKPSYYKIFKTHILNNIKTHDLKINATLEANWEIVIDAGINYFIENY